MRIKDCNGCTNLSHYLFEGDEEPLYVCTHNQYVRVIGKFYSKPEWCPLKGWQPQNPCNEIVLDGSNDCREHLRRTGKPYPRSSCKVCGSVFSGMKCRFYDT